MTQPATLRIDLESPIGRIHPRVYGHFAEHLARCCYDGLFLEEEIPGVPMQGGFRLDVVAALRDLPVPLLRWPGGCYADHYHWRDGIGPVETRRRTLGMSCGLKVEDSNALGTHEFMALCQMIGAEAYLAGNVGSGSVQELCDWLEYCNTPLNTTLGAERTANGAPEPFDVRLWGVGNENWGCGGNFDPVSYAHEYRRFASNLRHVDENAELVLCGHTNEWNVEVLAGLGEHLGLVDHLSIHRYWIHGGPETNFSDEEYYRLLAEADNTETFVRQTDAILREAMARVGRTRPIGIALDEWGVWHPEAREWGPQANARLPQTYEQAGTLRDALATAAALEGFHRQCNVLTLANLAQIVNVLHAPIMTDGAAMWLTPTYHLLRMHRAHIGAEALPVRVEGGEATPGAPTFGRGLVTPSASAVSATASRRDGALTLTILNRHLGESATVLLPDLGDGGGVEATGMLLAAGSPAVQNSAQHPDAVAPQPLTISRSAQGLWVELPPHSVATVWVR